MTPTTTPTSSPLPSPHSPLPSPRSPSSTSPSQSLPANSPPSRASRWKSTSTYLHTYIHILELRWPSQENTRLQQLPEEPLQQHDQEEGAGELLLRQAEEEHPPGRTEDGLATTQAVASKWVSSAIC